LGEGNHAYGRQAARLYERAMALGTFGRYGRLVAREVTRLGIRAGDRVLDLCCGTGLVTRELVRRLGPAGEVVAVDASAAMLEEAALLAGTAAGRKEAAEQNREAAAEKGPDGHPGPAPKVSYLQAEAQSLSLPDGSFDWATLFLGLHEISQAARLPALREVRRVLRPGGRGLVVDFAPGRPGFRRRIICFALRVLEGPDSATIVDPGPSALLAQAGLRPEKPRPALLGILEAVAFSRP